MEKHALLTLIHFFNGLEHTHLIALLTRRLNQSLDVLRETGTTIAATGIEELGADARVCANAFAHHVHIGTDEFAEIGDVVHERNARGKHGVGCILNHLCRRNVGEKDAVVGHHERSIEALHQFARSFALNTNHNAVGAHEVLDSSTFFQELGIGRHVKLDFHLSSGEFFGDDCLHFLSSAHGNCAFGDEHDIVIHVLSDLTRDLQDVTEVCGTVFIGRRADCAEDSLHLIQTVGQTGCEFQTPLTEVSHNHFFQSGLIDGHFPFGKHFYFFFVDVHAGHFNAHLGETCTGNKADVTGANDSYFHKTLKMFS